MGGETTQGYTSWLTSKLLRLWLVHLCVIFLVVAVLYEFDGVASYSVFSGGLVFLIPNIYFAICAFYHDAKSADGAAVLRNFYKGEVGKFLLSSTGFAVVFASPMPVNCFMLFGTYLGLTLVQWLVVVQMKF